jgi:hypothetical protein
MHEETSSPWTGSEGRKLQMQQITALQAQALNTSQYIIKLNRLKVKILHNYPFVI